ncbi:hypothetical protein, partial [Cereibacter sphaeroides]|uniref:hypothetical protein n=1 Tax=Cereibacter sphaeroides TaxID=1063 RepID=UPI001B355AF3
MSQPQRQTAPAVDATPRVIERLVALGATANREQLARKPKSTDRLNPAVPARCKREFKVPSRVWVDMSQASFLWMNTNSSLSAAGDENLYDL